MGKKRYSEEFKRSAVARVVSGDAVSLVAKECGASVGSLREWVNREEQSRRERPASKAEIEEIRRLKRELRRYKEDNEILKKAMALYAEECR